MLLHGITQPIRQIEPACPATRQRQPSNLQVFNAILYVAEHGCKWRGLPKRFGNWHTIYTRMNRWSKPACSIGCSSSCSMLRSCASRSRPSRWTAPSSRCIPTAPGAKKNGPQAIGKSRGGWTTKIHMVAADARTAITFSLSPGQAHDAPEGRKLLAALGGPNRRCICSWIAPTKATKPASWRSIWVSSLSCRPSRIEYRLALQQGMYKRRNEVERLFRRLKGFRRIFSASTSSTSCSSPSFTSPDRR